MKAKSVLISGIGIAGPTLAYWLKAAGFVPTLLERAPALRGGGYVIDFWGLGYDIAERMALLADIGRVGYRVRELRLVDDCGRRIAGFGTKIFGELTGGRYISLARSDLSGLIFNAIKDRCEVLFGDEIIALQDRDDAVDVDFRRGGRRRFDLVIGADGLRSAVRRLTFRPHEYVEKSLGYMVGAFESNGYRPRDEDVYVVHGEPGRQLARFALHGDRTLFMFIFAGDIDVTRGAVDLAAQKRILREHFGRDGWQAKSIIDELDRAEDLYFERVSQIVMERWWRGRVALVGDAAFCISLLGGQGSALAMTAAYVLAGELARCEQHQTAFENYENMLRPYIAVKQRGAERFSSFFAPKSRFGLFLRRQAIKSFRIPGLARYAFGKDIIDTLKLPDYSFAGRSSSAA